MPAVSSVASAARNAPVEGAALRRMLSDVSGVRDKLGPLTHQSDFQLGEMSDLRSAGVIDPADLRSMGHRARNLMVAASFVHAPSWSAAASTSDLSRRFQSISALLEATPGTEPGTVGPIAAKAYKQIVRANILLNKANDAVALEERGLQIALRQAADGEGNLQPLSAAQLASQAAAHSVFAGGLLTRSIDGVAEIGARLGAQADKLAAAPSPHDARVRLLANHLGDRLPIQAVDQNIARVRFALVDKLPVARGTGVIEPLDVAAEAFTNALRRSGYQAGNANGSFDADEVLAGAREARNQLGALRTGLQHDAVALRTVSSAVKRYSAEMLAFAEHLKANPRPGPDPALAAYHS